LCDPPLRRTDCGRNHRHARTVHASPRSPVPFIWHRRTSLLSILHTNAAQNLAAAALRAPSGAEPHATTATPLRRTRAPAKSRRSIAVGPGSSPSPSSPPSAPLRTGFFVEERRRSTPAPPRFHLADHLAPPPRPIPSSVSTALPPGLFCARCCRPYRALGARDAAAGVPPPRGHSLAVASTLQSRSAPHKPESRLHEPHACPMTLLRSESTSSVTQTSRRRTP